MDARATSARNHERRAALAWLYGLDAYDRSHKMFGIIALVLIVLWLLGFFAFHVTAAFIHILLVIALIMVVLHFMRGRRGI